jgi:hypothetical protein
MQHKRLLLLGTLLSMLALSPLQAAYWSPHVGADVFVWGLEPQYPLQDVFPRINKAGNIYVGTRINGFFGIDIGYQQSTFKRKTDVFTGTETIFAVQEAPGNATNITLRLWGPHIDFNFYWEVVKRFELIFMGGVAVITPDTRINHYSDGVWFEYRNNSEQKIMGRFGLGAQYNFIPCFGVKFMVSFEPGVRINEVGFDENNNFYDVHPYHNGTMYNLGFVYSFSKPRRGPPAEIADVWQDDDP